MLLRQITVGNSQFNDQYQNKGRHFSKFRYIFSEIINSHITEDHSCVNVAAYEVLTSIKKKWN